LIEENLIPYFKKRGAPRPFFVPIMADYTADQPTPTTRQAPIVFVGNSLGLAEPAVQEFMQRWRGRERLAQVIRQAEAELSVLDPAKNLYQCMDETEFPQLESEEEEYAIFRYLLCQGSAARRTRLLESIAGLGLQLFGGDWNTYLPQNSPLRQCYRGYLPMQEEPKTFSTGHIFVNIHSVGHVTGPNMRFFNVAGMGGFQITDGPEFSRYLELDTEAVFFASAEEFVEKVQTYRHRYQEADEIRANGQARTRRDWTYDRWVEMVFSQLNVVSPL
jgi:hypothetical protein